MSLETELQELNLQYSNNADPLGYELESLRLKLLDGALDQITLGNLEAYRISERLIEHARDFPVSQEPF